MSADIKGNNILKVLHISFWILGIIVFAVSIFLQVRVQYGDTSNQLLKSISKVLWIAGFALCVAAVAVTVILQVRQGKILQRGVLIIVFVCTMVFAGCAKSKLSFVFANGGDWKVVGKEHNLIGYRLQIRTTSPYTNTEAYIYCTVDVYKKLDTNQVYNIYFQENPFFKLGVLDTYDNSHEVANK